MSKGKSASSCDSLACISFFLSFFFYYTLSSGIQVQNLQVCYIDIHVPWWFAVPINLSSTLDISPNAVPPQAPVCDVPLPMSMCSHCPTYECEYVVFGFLFLRQFAESDGFQIHPRPCKGHELILFYGCIGILWCICAIFSLSSLSLMGIWVGSKSLLS